LFGSRGKMRGGFFKEGREIKHNLLCW
jgi:hypothetical protein